MQTVKDLPGIATIGITSVNIAVTKVALAPLEIFVRGILANALVCLAVYMALSVQDGISRVAVIVIGVSAFVAMGFEHSVANMFMLPAGFLASGGQLTALTMGKIGVNLVWSTLGNVVGGAGLVALPYWWVHLRGKK